MTGQKLKLLYIEQDTLNRISYSGEHNDKIIEE